MDDAGDDDDVAAVLQRWTDAGATWRVLTRTDSGVEISLRTCGADEEVDRIRSTDPAVLAYLDGRWASHE
ncbi:MAG: hypothetical protein QOJ32_1447 [Frankiaceae bacterium]|jgi:hypothetical protein|nr:hypothetical protein [Frankiaceae bacterium]MDQ1634638.1 hypothetical protein [Frankiaceae bacterium]MDQ1671987.1 hypothetical protein [Frankiaceae bacterium]